MRAAIRTGLLGTTITFSTDHPHPLPENAALKATEMLIKVKSAAINPVDYKVPRLLGGKGVGIDVSGVVEKVGADVTDLKAEDGVFGRVMLGSKYGSLADYAIVDTKEVAKKPEYLTFDEAAALGVAYLTGIQTFRVGKVTEGSSVLVIGASGGCGIAGVQLAKALGASRVVGICSGKNFDFVKEMAGTKNADVLELVDYTDEAALKKFREENVGKFDCIFDTSTGSSKGEDYTITMPKLLKEETGEYIQINGGAAVWAKSAAGKLPKQRNVVLVEPNGKPKLEKIASLLESLGVKPHLTVKSFDEKSVTEGFEQLKGRRTKGKIVFNMGD